MTVRQFYLLLELGVLFVGLPLLVTVFYSRLPVHPFVILWLLAAVCLVALLRDPGFDNASLWTPARPPLPRTAALRFAVLSALLVVAVLIFLPKSAFVLPRQRPALWLLIMVFYPLLSVLPQGVVYRSFLLHRYREVVPRGWPLVLSSALAFAALHAVLRNPIAIAMTFVGGLFFADTHLRTRSLVASSIEHTLYGCFVFTVGLGWYFFLGSVTV